MRQPNVHGSRPPLLLQNGRKPTQSQRVCGSPVRIGCLLMLVTVCQACRAGDGPAPQHTDFSDENAVQRVLSGKESVANAAWWGFDPLDATEAVQKAINSGANKVIIPYVGRDWVVKPVHLASNQEIIIEPGVVVTAKRGAFRGKHDCVFLGNQVDHVTLQGYGAVLRMHKADYTKTPYIKAEWRHVLSFRGASNINVLGLTLENSGGDGIYVGAARGDVSVPCRNVHIRDCICNNNHRQGMSVVSAEHLRVENCKFRNTRGTPPQTGIDIEPSFPNQVLVDIEIKNCIAEGNAGGGFQIYLGHLNSQSREVSVRFVNCLVRDSPAHGLLTLMGDDDAPGGLVEFRNCLCEVNKLAGLFGRWDPGAPIKLRFVNSKWRQVARNVWTSPIHFELSGRGEKSPTGGIEFVNCYIYDHPPRGALRVDQKGKGDGRYDISGDINVVSTLDKETVLQKADGLEGLRIKYHRRRE